MSCGLSCIFYSEFCLLSFLSPISPQFPLSLYLSYIT
uniref:Uncharacterized protein n=1 Tax=Rhizophora mucronata TaxID=61149 RepID=A0A2P2N957_RHIMU